LRYRPLLETKVIKAAIYISVIYKALINVLNKLHKDDIRKRRSLWKYH